jgi:long-chain acyl-CoA synthetase
LRILEDFKVPNFKFPKLKMEGISEIDEVAMEQHIQKKKDVKYETKNYKTIKEIFNKSTTEFSTRTFILEKFEHKAPFTEISYADYRKDVIGLGTGLIKLLNLKDKRVVIIGENTYHWYVSYMAMLCGVGIAVPVDKELPANEIENVVKRSKASAVIYSSKKKEVIKKIKDNLQEVEYFIEMNSNDVITGKDVGANYIIEQGNRIVESGDNSFMDITIDPEEFKVLIFTSGTTSNAKGVMINNRNLAQNVNVVAAYVYLNENDRFFSVLPLHHTYESSIGYLLPMSVGASIAICEGLKYIVPNLQETHPTAMLTVPILVENLYKKINANIVKSKKDKLVKSMIYLTNALKGVNIDVKRKVFKEIYDNLGGNIRIIVSAAAPIDAKIGKWVQDIGIEFLQGYGLTETAPISALTPEFDPRVGSAGKAVTCAELKIHNPNEKGEGEVYIKSDTLMIGYYEDEEATNEVVHIIDGERWFNSGDVGYLDEDGYLYITGRSKNVIVTQNGKNIYPEEIELLLGKIEEIKECMVYGKEEEGSKELLLSVKVIPDYEKIEEKHGKDLTEEEIHKIIWEEIKNVNKKLTSYKAIKNLEIKKDEFEKTTTMKIKRFAELQKDKK